MQKYTSTAVIEIEDVVGTFCGFVDAAATRDLERDSQRRLPYVACMHLMRACMHHMRAFIQVLSSATRRSSWHTIDRRFATRMASEPPPTLSAASRANRVMTTFHAYMGSMTLNRSHPACLPSPV